VEYRKEIDGLRALAVLAVIIYHFDFFPLTGGFLGVDVFFVISGYLISSILFREIDVTGTLSLSNFYLRRTRRILPALLACCLFIYLFFAITLQSLDLAFPRFGESVLAAIFSVSNIFYWFHSGYFAVDNNVQPLLHTWSLGVEEQFYMVIPMLLLVVSKGRGWLARNRWLLLLGIATGSFALCRWGRGVGIEGDFVFYMLPTRMWELLIGVLAALLLRKKNFLALPGNWLNNSLAAVAVIGLIFGFYFNIETTRIAEMALATTSLTALFILVANNRTMVGRLFASRIPSYIGKISYSWYLWHWPMYVASHVLAIKWGVENDLGLRVAMFAFSLLCSHLSWVYVETPFRTKRTWGECVKPLAPVFGLLVLLGGLLASGGLRGADALAMTKPDLPTVRKTFAELERKGLSRLGADSGEPSFLLIGDSHSWALAPMIDELARESGESGMALSAHGLRPLFYCTGEAPHSEDEKNVTKRFFEVLDSANIQRIIVAFRFDSYMNRTRHHPNVMSGEAGKEQMFLAEMKHFLRTLADKGREVWLMEQVPLARYDPALRANLLGDYSERFSPLKSNEIIEKAAEALDNPDIHILRPQPLLVRDGVVHFVKNRALLYMDDDHLSREGAFELKPLFEPVFKGE